jgi:peptidoglycan/xylan/chitin deacetylase (PgdA/CDA1 family)
VNRRLFLLAALPLSAFACNRSKPEVEPEKPKTPAKLSAADLKKYKPNEAGAIPVIMYHRFVASEKVNYLNRPPAMFRKDLEQMHALGYWPVNAWDVVANKMDVPAGKSPIVLTFDDALPSQFSTIMKNGEDKIDPDCAIGIMETFQKTSGWPARGTFFVLPKAGKNAEPFGQSEGVSSKFEYLVSKGYEVASHTATHDNMRGMSVAQVQNELALAVREVKKINKGAQMQTLAIPFGKPPRNAAAEKALAEGESGGTSYRNKAVFLAAWRPVASPLTKQSLRQDGVAAFNPIKLERITPGKGGKLEPGTLEYWLDWFKKNPGARYVSDGNPRVASIPQSAKETVDSARVAKSGVTPHFYDLNASSSGASGGSDVKSGGGLSVN